MRKKIFIFLFGVLLFSLSACTQKKKSYYPNGRTESEIPYRGGKMHGHAVWYYEHGVIRMEADYDNGRLQGELTRYYRNGKPESKAFYHLDTLEGDFLQYSEEGYLSEQICYEHGLKHGPYVAYHDGEQKKVEGAYNYDQFDGVWNYYDQNGFLVGRAQFHNGNGVLEAFDDQDNVIRSVEYRNSLKDGEEKIFDKDGNLLKILLYKEDRLLNQSVATEATVEGDFANSL